MSSLGPNCIILFSKKQYDAGCAVTWNHVLSNMSKLCVLIKILIYPRPAIFTKFSFILYSISSNIALYSHVIQLYILYCIVKKYASSLFCIIYIKISIPVCCIKRIKMLKMPYFYSIFFISNNTVRITSNYDSFYPCTLKIFSYPT